MCGSFNPRAPRGGRRRDAGRGAGFGRVSIHAPRAGRDLTGAATSSVTFEFQSTRPARGATQAQNAQMADLLFQSTLIQEFLDGRFQSTRPARGATAAQARFDERSAVSIHAPRAGRDTMRRSRPCAKRWFQSTRPARGATGYCRQRALPDRCFNPRAPRGARRPGAHYQDGHNRVSIHAPRAGRDALWRASRLGPWRFNPRAPRGARRKTIRIDAYGACFNPRAPRGARRFPIRMRGATAGFNPRAPRGARRPSGRRLPCSGCFNPRAPRGARRRHR